MNPLWCLQAGAAGERRLLVVSLQVSGFVVDCYRCESSFSCVSDAVLSFSVWWEPDARSTPSGGDPQESPRSQLEAFSECISQRP